VERQREMSNQLISLFLPSVHGGGAERAMLVFGGELARRGYKVDLVVAKFQGPHVNCIPEGMRVIDLDCSRMLKAITPLARYLTRCKPQALFSTITHANIAAVCAARWARVSCPVIVRQSNAPRAETKDSLGRYVASRIIPYAYIRASAVIAVSEGVKSELLELNCKLSRLTRVIPTPVLTEEVRSLGMEEPPHPWFRDNEIPVVLSAGRLEPHKGMLDLVRAFRQVRDGRPTRLVILGQGSDRARIEAEVKRLGLAKDVSLPGFFSNPFSCMRSARVFALASHYEGLPNVLIQALSFGTPVVATDCKSGPSEILERGRLGRLVPVGDTDALAQAILCSIDLPQQDAAREMVWRRYGAEGATTQYLQLAGLLAKAQGVSREGSERGVGRGCYG
jgi:glycosyltransferase involved in cell wall biosynthesis